MTGWDIAQIVLVVAAAVGMIFVVAWRRRTHHQFLDEFTDREVCEHLREALRLLKSRGHHVVRAGQVRPDSPLEIYLTPPFDPRQLAEELKLEKPVLLSESRNVLYCEEDWCELHPIK